MNNTPFDQRGFNNLGFDAAKPVESVVLERLEEQAVLLNQSGKPEQETPEEQTLESFGIVNRRTARAAGLRNPKRSGSMAVPGKK